MGWRSLCLFDITRIVTRRMKMQTIMIHIQQRLRLIPLLQRIILIILIWWGSHWIIHSDTIQVSLGLHSHPGFIETRRRRADL